MPRNLSSNRVAALPPRTDAFAAEELCHLLRAFALSQQRDQPQIFHPIREVARHFGVSLSTVARIYNRLEDEGILVSVRGSRTLLQGLSSARQLTVRGFVGLPVFTPWFVTLQDYRAFFLRIERELRARGFAVATIFYDAADLQQHDGLLSRIAKHEFDSLIWHQPDRTAKALVAQLSDSGVRVLGVSDRGFPSIRCRYEVQREPAIAAIFAAWRGDGISSAVVVRSRDTAAAKEELLKHLLNEARLDHSFRDVAGDGAGDFLHTLGTRAGEAIVLPSSAAAMCAMRAPEALGRMMARSRVALTGGAVSIPFAVIPEASADVVVVDWQLVAEQIAGELLSGKSFAHAETTAFEAQAHLRASLSQYAQSV
jgi:hypothetical protein